MKRQRHDWERFQGARGGIQNYLLDRIVSGGRAGCGNEMKRLTWFECKRNSRGCIYSTRTSEDARHTPRLTSNMRTSHHTEDPNKLTSHASASSSNLANWRIEITPGLATMFSEGCNTSRRRQKRSRAKLRPFLLRLWTRGRPRGFAKKADLKSKADTPRNRPVENAKSVLYTAWFYQEANRKIYF